MNKDIGKILISEEEIALIVSEIAEKINRDYKDVEGRLVLLCTLKGSLPFTADLMRRITLPVELECVKASSYGSGTSSTGVLKIALDIPYSDLSGLNIIVIDDIVDSGITLSNLVKNLTARGARSVKTCTLLDKPARRRVDITPDYRGRVIPDEFVVGYGLDYDEKYRSLPYIGVLKPEVYGGE